MKKTKKRVKNKTRSLLTSNHNDWTFDLIELYFNEIEKIATEDFKLDVYPNQIEVISSEQMLDAYSSVALPVLYTHWSYGKEFIYNYKHYTHGRMGLAYEVVINSSPCIAYLMEENTMVMQALVMAHACFGHNYFFKNNYLFKQWTDAEAIIDYLVFAKKFIADCEEKYGVDAVEEVIDSCHTIQNYGVDRYKRPPKLSLAEEKERLRDRNEYIQRQLNELWNTIPVKDSKEEKFTEKRFPVEPQENLLYFIEKNAPNLDTWKREIVRIVRKINQYFYPQRQTKMMNEGCATFFHYEIISRMYDKGLVDDGFMLEFYSHHTGVVNQTGFDSKYYGGINPYALGFAIFQDIKRISLNPTDEDRKWFPSFAGNGDWLEVVQFAVKNFKDESFVQQYLSPKVIRDFRLFSLLDDERNEYYEVSAIHDDEGYKHVRSVLAEQYNLTETEPLIQIYNVDRWGDRSLVLRHYMQNEKMLDQDTTLEVMKHVKRLWGFDVYLETIDPNEKIRAEFTLSNHGSVLDIFPG